MSEPGVRPSPSSRPFIYYVSSKECQDSSLASLASDPLASGFDESILRAPEPVKPLAADAQALALRGAMW